MRFFKLGRCTRSAAAATEGDWEDSEGHSFPGVCQGIKKRILRESSTKGIIRRDFDRTPDMTHEIDMLMSPKALRGIGGRFCIQCDFIWSMIIGMWPRSLISSNNENERREFTSIRRYFIRNVNLGFWGCFPQIYSLDSESGIGYQ